MSIQNIQNRFLKIAIYNLRCRASEMLTGQVKPTSATEKNPYC